MKRSRTLVFILFAAGACGRGGGKAGGMGGGSGGGDNGGAGGGDGNGGTGGSTGGNTTAPGGSGGSTGPETEYWPFHRRDPARTGYTPATGAFSGPPSVRWKFVPGSLVEVSPVVAPLDGGGKPDVAISSYAGKLYVLDATQPGPAATPLWSAGQIAESADFVEESAAIADLDGDPSHLEVVFAGDGGKIYALRADGSALWTFSAGDTRSWSSPVVADVDGDGDPDVVVHADAMYVIDGKTGKLVWKKDACLAQNMSSPAVADLDGDGKLDIVGCPGWDGYLKAFNGPDGAVKWRSAVNGNFESTPAIADLDGDGAPEVIYGVAGKGTVALEGKTGALKWVGAMDFTGPACQSPSVERILSSPAVGQLDDDPQLEVAEGSNDSCDLSPSGFYVFDGKTGSRQWKFMAHSYVESSPVIADLDPTSPGNEILFGDHKSYLVLLGRDGKKRWDIQLPGPACGECKIVSSPALVDIDGVPGVEILVGTNQGAFLALKAP